MEFIDIRMDNFVSHVAPGEPVTLGFSLLTDGTAPPVGSRLEFRAYNGAKLLHASMPVTGAQMRYIESLQYSIVTITEEQAEGWNPRRTLTFSMPPNMDPSQAIEMFGINYYQPSYQAGYCPVLVQTGGPRDISIRQALKAKWQDQPSGGWVYSYDVIVKANAQSIAKWKFSSAGLPTGVKIFANPWLDVIHDGTEGVIELVTPPDDQYLLLPGKELSVSIQLLYPQASGAQPAFETLPNLMAFPN
ncbi:hypothetical protein [Pseudomonas sp. B35(2017)]|uniref:hypothetical protein n=1 Tax=Pseudomonas sp. B35(2017) TaxID=1981722 RepID=UPI000A1D9BA6|nr:hypothetical protein [Pseudomonas sp. B35(2017)]